MKKVEIVVLVCLSLLFFVACNSDSEFDKTMYEFHKVYVELTNGMTKKYDLGFDSLQEVIRDFQGKEIDEKLENLDSIVRKLSDLSNNSKEKYITEKYKNYTDTLKSMRKYSENTDELSEDDLDEIFYQCSDISMMNRSFKESLKALHLLDETD